MPPAGSRSSSPSARPATRCTSASPAAPTACRSSSTAWRWPPAPRRASPAAARCAWTSPTRSGSCASCRWSAGNEGMRTTLIAWCASALALVPAAAGEALVTRAQALTDAPGRDDAAGEPASPAPGATVAQRLEDEAGIELIVALIRAGQHERAAVYLEDQALPGRYRLLMRIPPERHPDPGFAPPQILHPLVDQGPERAWLVRISRPTGGNGGWMEERLLSLRRSGAGAPALDEVDFVAAPQAYQP